MAEPKTVARASLRVAVLLATTASILAGVPLSPGGTTPETVVRTVRVSTAALAGASLGPGLRLVGGELHAASPERTATTRVCAPIWATGLGVTWRQHGGGDVVVGVRPEDDRDRAGAVVHLDAGDDADPASPDAASGRRGSGFLWTGGSRCVRLSMALPRGAAIAGVRVVFVNASGTSAGPGTGPPDLERAGESLPTASALARRPRIMTRERWGADPDLMNCTPLIADQVRMGFVHHTAGSNDYSRAEADDVVRGVYAYHTNGRGWCDIGYNFLIDRFGTIYEGRSGGVELPVIGAAQMGFNTRAFSVSVMGNFEIAAVPRAVRRALVRLLAWRLDVAHVNPRARATMISAGGSTTRYDAGDTVRLATISGHRDTGYTACPGARLYPLLPKIRDRVARRGLPKIYKPRLSIAELTAGVPADLRMRARGSGPLLWSVTLLGPDGAVVAQLGEASGRELDLTWPGIGPPAQPTTPGAYSIAIAAMAPDGRLARSAFFSLTVLSAPTPTPSPPPSPSPSSPP